LRIHKKSDAEKEVSSKHEVWKKNDTKYVEDIKKGDYYNFKPIELISLSKHMNS
jgi:hypothetical protein